MKECTDPTLPPVGSLWRHKDGERRFVVGVIWPHGFNCKPRIHFACPTRFKGLKVSLADWLAWQADAVRIDREEA